MTGETATSRAPTVRGTENVSLTRDCPRCGSDFRGEPIPPEYIAAGYYGSEDPYYSRLIGVEIPGVYDGVLFWVCPDCRLAFQRWSEGDRLNKRAAPYIADNNNASGDTYAL